MHERAGSCALRGWACGTGVPRECLSRDYPQAERARSAPVEGSGGQLCLESLPELLRASQQADAVLIGCGVGRGTQTDAAVLRLIAEIEKPLVIDADGINILAEHIDLLRRRSAPAVLTPHPGEMGRLMGVSAAAVQSDREQAAEVFAPYPNVTLVLKGSGTIVAAPDGSRYYNPTGNCGMAKGGSGDVLAGMLVSLLAQGMDPAYAAVAAVFIHGLCGDRCAARHSIRGMLPSDMINELADVMRVFE